MLVVIPVAPRTAPLLEQMTKLFEKIGPQSSHTLLVLSCPSVMEEAQTFAQAVSRLFRDVATKAMSDTIQPNVQSRNQMFVAAAYAAQVANMPFLWLEHALPTQRNWLDNIQDEYDRHPDKPYLGCIEPTWYRATDDVGKILPFTQHPDDGLPEAKFVNKGEHMRFGVYSPTLVSESMLIPTLNAIPFEAYLQNEIIPRCRQSKVMATVWASRNFERNSNSRIVGEQTPGIESEIRAEANHPVDDRAVSVIHGCQDASLGFVLLKKTFTTNDDAIVQAAQNQTDEAKAEIERLATELGEAAGDNLALQKRVAELEEHIASLPEIPKGTGADVDKLEAKIEKKDKTITQLRGQLNGVEKEKTAVTKERTALKAKVTRLEKKLSS